MKNPIRLVDAKRICKTAMNLRDRMDMWARPTIYGHKVKYPTIGEMAKFISDAKDEIEFLTSWNAIIEKENTNLRNLLRVS